MLEFRDVSYAEADTTSYILQGVNFALKPGEHAILVGPNGAGKSTLARLANGSYMPTGGSVVVDGLDTVKYPRQEIAVNVSYVQQDPTSQLVSMSVYDEVAFGPKNLLLDALEIDKRVKRALEQVDLLEKIDATRDTLSGGELQRLALAGALAIDPKYLVLDEVAAHLDGRGRAHVRDIVTRLCAEGIGVLEISQLSEDIPFADRVLVLSQGSIFWEGTPQAFFTLPECIERASAEDALSELLKVLASEGVNVRQALLDADYVKDVLECEEIAQRARRSFDSWLKERSVGDVLLEFKHISKHYGTTPVLEDINLSIRRGELCVVSGPSGAGKSTIAQIAAGVLAPDAGEVLLEGNKVSPGQVGLVFQRVEDMLFCPTVKDELEFGLRTMSVDASDASQRAQEALSKLGLDESYLERSPFELSGGEKRRVALAAIIATNYPVYVFDESMAGLDGHARILLHQVIQLLLDAGAAILLVTHDVDRWVGAASTLMCLEGGRASALFSACEIAEHPEELIAALSRMGYAQCMLTRTYASLKGACHE